MENEIRRRLRESKEGVGGEKGGKIGGDERQMLQGNE